MSAKVTFTEQKQAQRYAALCRRLNYTFLSEKWLRQALTHRSYGLPNNERLEFIGDGILNYAVADLLYERFPDLSEGQLSRLRATLVNQDSLAVIARDLRLGDFLFLGEGELKSGGFDRASILADALEAIFAAIRFDSELAQAVMCVRHLYQARLKSINPNVSAKDPKSVLQEVLQDKKQALPRYTVIAQTGDANEAYFEVSCDLGNIPILTKGKGGSRRIAEQMAATAAHELLLAFFANHKILNKKGKPS